MKKALRRLLLLGLLTWLAFSFPSGRPLPAPPELPARLAYLTRVVGEGAGPGTELGEQTRLNPEWGLFTLAFSTYAVASLAAREPARRAQAARFAAQAVRGALSRPVRQPFADDEPVLPGDSLALPASVLYLGHLNLMLGCLRTLDPATPYAPLHDSLSARLFRRFAGAPAGNLASYPRLRWLADNTVALASLARHARLTGSPYAAAGRRWVARAHAEWLDPETGLLASQVDRRGRPTEAPRGSGLGWSIWFLQEVDPAFARAQYTRFQATGSTNLGAVRLYREVPGAWTTGPGDVDSGPLVLGYGIPATTFAYADAVALGDWPNARRLRRVIGFGSRAVRQGAEVSYRVRFLDLPVNPLADALLLWADAGVPQPAPDPRR